MFFFLEITQFQMASLIFPCTTMEAFMDWDSTKCPVKILRMRQHQQKPRVPVQVASVAKFQSIHQMSFQPCRCGARKHDDSLLNQRYILHSKFTLAIICILLIKMYLLLNDAKIIKKFFWMTGMWND